MINAHSRPSNRAKLPRHAHSGFTLLEIMVALMIFSVCAATLIQQSGRNLRQLHQLETRTLANWVAENELERLRLQGFPATGKQSREINFASLRWQVIQDVSVTNNSDLKKVIVDVSPADEQDNRYRLIGFLGKH